MGGPLSNKRHEPQMKSSDGPYVALIHSKAENYSMALGIDDPEKADLMARREEMHRLLDPHTVIELCNAWKKLQQRQAEDEMAELMEMEG